MGQNHELETGEKAIDEGEHPMTWFGQTIAAAFVTLVVVLVGLALLNSVLRPDAQLRVPVDPGYEQEALARGTQG